MNQKEAKLMIMLFILPLWLSYTALVVLVRIFYGLSRMTSAVLKSDSVSNALSDFYVFSEKAKYVYVIIGLACVGSAFLTKTGLVSFWQGLFFIFATLFVIVAAYQIYLYVYFSGVKFRSTKTSIENHIKNCNDLNTHIYELTSANLNFSYKDYGDGILEDRSNYKFKRSEWSKINGENNVYNCSSSVLKNASSQPFKYLCKYFDVDANEGTLSTIEFALNQFLAANQGRTLLIEERNRILNSIQIPTPYLVFRFNKNRLIKNLGFDPIHLNEISFPVYIFRYVSPGGNSSYEFSIRLDLENLEQFIIYLGEIIKFNKTVYGQRALMTKALRRKIKMRDNFTCQLCNLSIADEENLLLEIDHIIPLSKGGVTSEDNLQTLCWRCNRSKGSKIYKDTARSP